MVAQFGGTLLSAPAAALTALGSRAATLAWRESHQAPALRPSRDPRTFGAAFVDFLLASFCLAGFLALRAAADRRRGAIKWAALPPAGGELAMLAACWRPSRAGAVEEPSFSVRTRAMRISAMDCWPLRGYVMGGGCTAE